MKFEIFTQAVVFSFFLRMYNCAFFDAFRKVCGPTRDASTMEKHGSIECVQSRNWWAAQHPPLWHRCATPSLTTALLNWRGSNYIYKRGKRRNFDANALLSKINPLSAKFLQFFYVSHILWLRCAKALGFEHISVYGLYSYKSKDEHYITPEGIQPRSQSCSGGFIKTKLCAICCCCFFGIGVGGYILVQLTLIHIVK